MPPSPPHWLIKPAYPSFHWGMLFLFPTPYCIAFFGHVSAGVPPCSVSFTTTVPSGWLIYRRGRCELHPLYRSAWILFQAPSLPPPPTPPPPPSDLLLTGFTRTALMDKENKWIRTLEVLPSAKILIYLQFWQDFNGISEISSGSVGDQLQNHHKLLTPFLNTPINTPVLWSLYFLPLLQLPITHRQWLLS